MGYVIAAYAVGIGGVALYAALLFRERRALRRRLSETTEPNPG